MKNRCLSLLALSLTLGLLTALPAMASEIVETEAELVASQTVQALAIETDESLAQVEGNTEPQFVLEEDVDLLGPAMDWVQAETSLIPEGQNGCFPPSPPPPSCDCSFCCECNKCWQNGQLVKMPCS